MTPGREGEQLSTERTEEMLAHMPVIDLGGVRLLSVGELQDLEDHGELDPLLAAVVRRFVAMRARKKKDAPPV
jgi:hypothetical protein